MGALGSIAGGILGRVLVGRILPSLGRLEPGRYPHPQWGPIIIPPSPELQPGERAPLRLPFKLTTPGLIGAIALTYYFYERSQKKKALAGERPLFIEPEKIDQPDLFPKLKRELRLKAEEIPTTASDPVEECLERRGWKLARIRELKRAIDQKTTPSMFTQEEEPLTSTESELLNDIETCLDKVERQYGSLEAAGIGLVPCPLCDGEEDQLSEVSPQS